MRHVHDGPFRTFFIRSLAAVALALAGLLAGAGGTSAVAVAANEAPEWVAPTPAEGSTLNATVGEELQFSLSALDPNALDTVHISSEAFTVLGSTVTSVDGNPASATFSWTPGVARDVSAQFIARDNRLPAASSPIRTVHIHVFSRNAPVVTLAPGNPLAVDEGPAEVAFDYTVEDADAGDTISAVTTACGAAGTKVSGSDTRDDAGGSFRCVFPDGPATSNISVRATDNHGSVSAPARQAVAVRNVGPTATWIPDYAPSVPEGRLTERAFNFSVSDPGNDTVSAINASCGAGGTLVEGSVTDSQFECVFADGPAFSTVSVTATDSDGDSGAGASHDFMILNVAPIAVLDPDNELTVDAGSAEHTYAFSVFEPGDDTVEEVVTSCGTGGTKVAGSDTPTSFACVFPDGPASSTVSVRATDSDGETGAADTQDVTVRASAPTATLDPGNDLEVDEGTTQHTYAFSVDDPDAVASIDASCGSGGTLVAGSETASSFRCVFPDGPATSTVSVSATDADGDTGPTDTQEVTVHNVAPVVTIAGGDTDSVDEGPAPQTVSFSVTDPGDDTIDSVVTSCGDGATKVDGSQTASSVQCVFPDGPASPTVSVSATDSDGAAGSGTQVITVRNVAPAVTLDAGGDSTVDEGAAQHTYAFSVSDPGEDTVQSIDASCGTGGTLVGGSVTSSSFACRFPDGPASPTLTVRATDSDDDTGAAATRDVTVRNVAPTVALDAGGDATVDEGQTQHTYAFSISDPGDDTVGAIDASCGTGGTLVSGSTTASSVRCVFPDGPASSVLSVRATDSDGDTGSADSRTITVRNVAPVLTLAQTNDLVVNVAVPPTYTFTVFDPGIDTYTVNPSCGTGGTVTAGSPTATSFGCTFSRLGYTTLAASATDSDGDRGPTDTQQVLVYAFPADGKASFLISDSVATVNRDVTFWGTAWSGANPFSSGATAPNGFKGYATKYNPAIPTCGSTWTLAKKDANAAPDTLPAYMGVAVTGAIEDMNGNKSGGTVTRIVVVKDPVYKSAPGHPGIGKVIAVDCG